MTEDQLYMAYVAHQRDCGICGARSQGADGGRTDRRCEAGLEIANRWRAAAVAQNAGTQPIRRREPAGRR